MHNVTIIMGSWLYNAEEMKLHFINEDQPVDTNELIMPGEWKYKNVSG